MKCETQMPCVTLDPPLGPPLGPLARSGVKAHDDAAEALRKAAVLQQAFEPGARRREKLVGDGWWWLMMVGASDSARHSP